MTRSYWLGAFALGLITLTSLQAQQPTSPTAVQDRWERFVERLSKQLGLTTQQQEQLRTLLRQRWEEQQRLRERFRSQLKELLTPEQWEKLQQLPFMRGEKLRQAPRELLRELRGLQDELHELRGLPPELREQAQRLQEQAQQLREQAQRLREHAEQLRKHAQQLREELRKQHRPESY